MSNLVPKNLEEYLKQWVVEHPSYKDDESYDYHKVIIKIDYHYMLEGVYRN